MLTNHRLLAFQVPFFYTHHLIQAENRDPLIPLAVVQGNRVMQLSPAALSSGVPPSLPLRSLRQAIPDLEVVKYQPDIYEEPSRLIYDACTRFSPIVEPLYPHYGLVNVTGCPSNTAHEVQRAIAATCGTPAIVGVASTRWVARCAVRFLRQQQNSSSPVFAVKPGQEKPFLAPLSLSYLQESGMAETHKVISRLSSLGITTFHELAAVPMPDLTGQFGVVTARELQQLAIGTDRTPIRPLYPPDHIVVSFTASPDSGGLANTTAVDHLLIQLSTEMSGILALRGLATTRLELVITLAGSSLCQVVTAKKPISQAASLLAAYRRLWSKAQVKEAVWGITLRGKELESPMVAQESVLAGTTSREETGLNRAMRFVQSRFGTGTLVRAGEIPLARRELLLELWERENL